MKSSPERLDSTELLVTMGLRQNRLLVEIATSLTEIADIRPFLGSGQLGMHDRRLASFQLESALLEVASERPLDLLPEDQRVSLEQSKVDVAPLLCEFSDMVSGGRYLARRQRIMTLLEHLERRLSDKRASLNFNRAVLVSSIAALAAIASLLVSLAK